jgi:hypothetical protein
MPTILKFRKYSNAGSQTITGALAELTVDTDKQSIRVHDGNTAGGSLLATEDHVASRESAIRNDIYVEFDTSTEVDNKDATTLASANQYTDDILNTSYSTTIVVDQKDAATLASAESYTDGRETAIRSDLAGLISNYDTSIQVDGKIANALIPYNTALEVDGKIDVAINDLIGGAPGTLNTLNEIAVALGNDENYAASITTALSTKAPLESPIFTGIPTAPTPVNATNDTQLATTAFVQSVLDQTLRAMFPTGIITLWEGSVASIPSGYVLCDGTNGTPNLTDKFVSGAGNTYVPGDTGGADFISLTNNELPTHNHTGTVDSNGAHTHFVINTDIVTAGSEITSSNSVADNGNLGTAFSYNLGGSTTTPTAGLSSSNGAHTHTFTTDDTGTGQPFDIRPQYYSLCYIMRKWS